MMSDGFGDSEMKSLIRPKDNYQKTILTMDCFGPGNENGATIKIHWTGSLNETPSILTLLELRAVPITFHVPDESGSEQWVVFDPIL